ncbi:sterol O-acyltransferase 1-like isoform X3 [Amphibalanus amphitrite]|uniref:sterol O-acyltransferase 1-like isoform X3 n=1 Tax=Amphibalanus amphitrite TaxID=1232801 RepID=UPI001C914894|nr:sterol O-acyltransferase 1-like isoform X3 [Amphibalanus amphitrite]
MDTLSSKNDIYVSKVTRDMEVDKLRSRIQVLQEDITSEFRSQLSTILEQHLAGLEQVSAPRENGDVKGNKRSKGKQFVARESLLTELFEISHIRTIYHIFLAMLALMFLHSILYDLAELDSTSQVRWRLVALHFGQVVGCVVYTAFLLERLVLPPFQRYGLGRMTWRHLVVHVFGSVMPGMLCYLCAFFALLHAWMNAFAEMTRFADRMFYQDWWNVTNYASFYRTWNIVVHDWLYEYIYTDVARLRGKFLATLSVFVVSSIVHEYTLMLVFNFCFPVLFIQFGVFGVLLHFFNVRSAGGNVLLWMTLSLGIGIDLAFYAAEWYARQNCPSIYENVYADFFSSRALSCWSGNGVADTVVRASA